MGSAWFSQGGIASAVVFGCSQVCCSPCGLTSACFDGFGAGVGYTGVSIVAWLTAV